MKHETSRPPAPTLEPLRGAPPPGPVRFALDDASALPADDRADCSLLINLGAPCLISQGANELCLRPIRCETPALRLLRDYVGAGRDEETVADGSLQRLFVSHVHDLIACAFGASQDGAAPSDARAQARHGGVTRARCDN